MSSRDPLIVQQLATQMAYLDQRQKLLAQNIANIDTPNYQAQDLKKLDFNAMANTEAGRLQMTTTAENDIVPSQKDGPFRSDKDKTAFERKPLGNNIVLDEQMGHISDVGAQSQLNTTLYHKYNQLYQVALDSKGS